MQTIYEPKGKAREYSPLALNVYSGCDHGCKYCYVPNMFKAFSSTYRHDQVKAKTGIHEALEKYCKKNDVKNQTLLSFTCDPYCKLEETEKTTSICLEILARHNVPTAILTKGGIRVLSDIDKIKQFGPMIKIGATLTMDNDHDSIDIEPRGSLPGDRLEMLRILHEKGITTWASIEPVIDAEQSLNMIARSLPFVNHYKVGKLNHWKEQEEKTDWHNFLVAAVSMIRAEGKSLYVKRDLAQYAGSFKLYEKELDMDALALYR